MRGIAKTAGKRGHVDLLETERPDPGPNEAVVDVAYAGLCGSDLGVYEFEDAFEFMTFPTVMGHEYSGTVVEVGEHVARYEPGDRVVEEVIRGCGECERCLRGAGQLCDDARITGIHHDGAFAPYIAVPEKDLHRLPDDVALREAAIVEPTAVAARAVTRNSAVRPGDDVLVEGPGPIGILVAQIARRQGGDVLVSGVATDATYRLPLADALGFDVVDVTETDVEARTEAFTDGGGFDVVFDATGHESGLRTAATVVAKGGQVVVVGLTGDASLSFTPLVRGEVAIQCSYTYDWSDFETAIELVRAGEIDTEQFIDTGYSLTDPIEPFEAMLAGETCKPVFDVSGLE